MVSKKVIPLNKVQSAPILNENALPNPNAHAIAPTNAADRALPSDVFSTTQATAGSNNEMLDVIAAKVTSTKNRVQKICPPTICPKAIGKVINMSPGPA